MVISECTTYIVRFFKGSAMKMLYILAHDKEEAIKLAEMQAKYSKMGAGKFEVFSVFKEGEPDPFEETLDKVRFY